MSKSKFMFALVSMLTVAATLMPTSVMAVTGTSGGQGNLQQTVAAKKAEISERVENRCQKAEQRVAELIAKYEAGQNKYTSRYAALVTKLNNLVQMLENKGINSQNLPAHIAKIESMVGELESGVAQVVDLLKQTQTLACGESEGEYLLKLMEAKEAGLTVRQKAMDINQYFISEVIPELKEIRAAYLASKTPNERSAR